MNKTMDQVEQGKRAASVKPITMQAIVTPFVWVQEYRSDGSAREYPLSERGFVAVQAVDRMHHATICIKGDQVHAVMDRVHRVYTPVGTSSLIESSSRKQ